MYVHEDSPGEGHEDELTRLDMWSTCTSLDYGVIVYFGDYEGGEVFYPELDAELWPGPGDLVIHGALSKHKHGVKEVTKGIRYAFANFCLPAHKNPGTFYNFNTPEYQEQIKKLEFLNTFEQPFKKNERLYKKLVEPEYDPHTDTWFYKNDNSTEKKDLIITEDTNT